MQDIEIILTVLVWGAVMAAFLHVHDARKRELSDKSSSDKKARPEKQITREPETSI
jgi:hypothetical protein